MGLQIIGLRDEKDHDPGELTDVLPVDLLEQTNKPVRGQTIQLAAKGSFDEAEAYWSRITTRFPELEGYQKTITPAVVRSKQYYRLRATGPDARAVCSTMKQSGADCFPVS